MLRSQHKSSAPGASSTASDRASSSHSMSEVSDSSPPSYRRDAVAVGLDAPTASTSKATAADPAQQHAKSIGTQTDYTTEPAKRSTKQRRRTCSCCINRWNAVAIAVAAVLWAYKPQV